MDKQIRAIIEKAKKDKNVLAVAVFGSYARKEKYNDIDICIFLRKGNYSNRELSSKKLEYTLGDEKYDIQIFQQLPLYIQERILKEAQILFCVDEDKLYDLYFETLRDLEYFKPIYENYLEGVVHG